MSCTSPLPYSYAGQQCVCVCVCVSEWAAEPETLRQSLSGCQLGRSQTAKGEDGWRREMENKEQLRQKSEGGGEERSEEVIHSYMTVCH